MLTKRDDIGDARSDARDAGEGAQSAIRAPRRRLRRPRPCATRRSPWAAYPGAKSVMKRLSSAAGRLWRSPSTAGRTPTRRGEDRCRRRLYAWRRAVPPPSSRRPSTRRAVGPAPRKHPDGTPCEAFVTMNVRSSSNARERSPAHHARSGDDASRRVTLLACGCALTGRPRTQVRTLVSSAKGSRRCRSRSGKRDSQAQPLGPLPRGAAAADTAAYAVVANVYSISTPI